MSARTPLHANPVSPPSCPPDFPCSWEDPADATLSWTLERAHWPEPMAPLVFAIAGEALARGLSAAMRAYAYPVAEPRLHSDEAGSASAEVTRAGCHPGSAG